MKTHYVLWQITRAGWHAQGTDSNGNQVRLCTYCQESVPEPKDLVQSQGALVLDCRSMPDNDVLDAVMKGPMHESSLKAGEVREALCDPRPYVPGETLTALMQCSTSVYVNYWLSFPEVCLGRVSGRHVVWSDRGIKPIMPVL